MSLLQLRLLMRMQGRLEAERALLQLDIALAGACAPWGGTNAVQGLAEQLRAATHS